MKIRFWGTRGSLPTPLTATEVRAKISHALSGAQGLDLQNRVAVERYLDTLDADIVGTYGGNTSCVQIEMPDEGNTHILFDLGSGVRPFGVESLKRYGRGVPQIYHVFMSHVHWDHIMGFPFFEPAYIPGNQIVIHSCHAQVASAFAGQQKAPCFPVDFHHLAAQIDFRIVEPGQPETIAGSTVTAFRQHHSGDSYAWRIERDGKHVVYSTDGEHKPDDLAGRERYIRFIEGADVVIFDAMYSLADSIAWREDWGHSSNVLGIELCQAAGVKKLCLFHHDPANNDAEILRVFRDSVRYEKIVRAGYEGRPLDIAVAWDGLEIDL